MKNDFAFNYSMAAAKGTREIQEDASWFGTNKNNEALAIVCDGIGSQDDSQIASLMTVEVFRHAFEKHSKIRNINTFFFKCLKTAYNQITNVSIARLNSKKIGTTLLVAFIKNNQVHVFNLGDTRLYHYDISVNTWNQITRDHNLYNHFLDLKDKNDKLDINALCTKYKTQLLSLTRCLESGSNYHLKYDKYVFNLEIGDDIFIATDGVYHFINLNEVSQITKNSASQFSAISNIIVQKALENKSNDNLTSFILERINGDTSE